MSGPKTERLNTSPIPGLQQPGIDLLTSLLSGQTTQGFSGSFEDWMRQQGIQSQNVGGFPSLMNAQGQRLSHGDARTQFAQAQQPSQRFGGLNLNDLNQRLGLSFPTSPLNQQLQNSFSNFLAQPSAAERTFNAQFGDGRVPGGDILAAAQPIFDRNLAQGTAAINEAGPRFASANLRERGNLAQGSLQDFNLFSQQVMESGRNRQLQAAMAADQSRLGGMQAAGQFNLGQQGQELGFQQQGMQNLQFLLSQLFGAGGFQSAPGFVQTPGFMDQLIKALGAGGALAAAV